MHEVLSDDDRDLVLQALRSPRGRYAADRAAQLSAVPSRTLHDWATSGILVPDWMNASPRGWSYRDILYARLLAWLRSKGMERARASGRVLAVRELMARAVIQPHLRSDGTVMLLEDESVDRFSGQQVFDGLSELLDVFEMTEPIEGVSRAELWGPSLVRPSRLTYISPWVLGGEPCVADSRVPTSAIYALRIERSLDTGRIHALYPELPEEAIEDAIELEGRLRAA
jgi:uncharacterized protein (DUF433 family)